MLDPFRIFVVLVYTITIAFLLFRYFKSRKNIIYKDNTPINETGIANGTPFNLIRNQYFLYDQPLENTFYINSFMKEVFNIFIKLSPSMISTLTKVERRMVGLKVAIDNPVANEEYIKGEIDYLNSILDELVKVSHSMIEKLEEHIVSDSTNSSKIQIPNDTIQLYTNAVNILMDLTDNHAMLNYEIHCRMVNSYPELVEPFRIISGKVTYLFFINLISYSNKIDENIIICD